MAYSSVAQTGFLLIGVAAMSINGVHFLMFYASVFLIANFLTFLYLQQFEVDYKTSVIQDFGGHGVGSVLPSVFLLAGLISLTGLPPVAGFTSKLLIFTSLWEAYDQTGKTILLVLFAFGLINTVVALFFYLKIPYYLFFKTTDGQHAIPKKRRTFENLLGFLLVVGLLLLFFQPGLLMGWINRISFVL
jgi:NADH-quinone oxidoreductase subunit N